MASTRSRDELGVPHHPTTLPAPSIDSDFRPAGAASTSATIDLIWADTSTDEISNVPVSSEIKLQGILTAGPNGSQGAFVNVDYSEAIGTLTLVDFENTPGEPLQRNVGNPIDTGSRIETINAFSGTRPTLFVADRPP